MNQICELDVVALTRGMSSQGLVESWVGTVVEQLDD